MTSNLGAAEMIHSLAGGLGFAPPAGLLGKGMDKKVKNLAFEAARRKFFPEFLNRIDDIIIFHSLDEAQLERIVDVQLKRLEKRLKQQNLELTLDVAAKKFLAKEGYDPQFGARPLKRTIQEELLDPLSMKLLSGEFKPGDRIKVTAADNELIFQNGEHTSAKSSG